MRNKVLTFLALVAITGVLGVAFLVGAAAGGTATKVDLNNNTADTETNCPDTVHDFWHFVLTPNNGTLAFVSITLNLGGGTTKTFPAAGPIIPNNGMLDNVYVQVPAGFSLDDLQLTGSSAQVSGPVTENTKFNLGGVCEGVPPTTTTVPVEPVPAPANFTG